LLLTLLLCFLHPGKQNRHRQRTPSRTKTIEEVDAIKTALHAMKIEFEVSNEEYYNPEFVAKIEKSRQDFKDGKGKAYTTEQLNALWK